MTITTTKVDAAIGHLRRAEDGATGGDLPEESAVAIYGVKVLVDTAEEDALAVALGRPDDAAMAFEAAALAAVELQQGDSRVVPPGNELGGHQGRRLTTRRGLGLPDDGPGPAAA